MKRPPVTPEEFVVAWMLSRTAAEVATRLYWPKGLVVLRGDRYRRLGARIDVKPDEWPEPSEN
jgi:hypothetical protein